MNSLIGVLVGKKPANNIALLHTMNTVLHVSSVHNKDVERMCTNCNHRKLNYIMYSTNTHPTKSNTVCSSPNCLKSFEYFWCNIQIARTSRQLFDSNDPLLTLNPLEVNFSVADNCRAILFCCMHVISGEREERQKHFLFCLEGVHLLF